MEYQRVVVMWLRVFVCPSAVPDSTAERRRGQSAFPETVIEVLPSAFDHLPHDERIVLWLLYGLGWPQHQVAEYVKVSVRQVQRKRTSGVERLVAVLQSA